MSARLPTRLDRRTAGAVAAPLPGCLAAFVGLGLVVALHRLPPDAPIPDLATLLRLGLDVGLGTLPTVAPAAVGLAVALGWGRLRDAGELQTLAGLGVGPARALVGPAGVVILIAAATLPLATHVGPAARARVEHRTSELAIRSAQAQWTRGEPGVVARGRSGAAFVLGPDLIAWLSSEGEAAVGAVEALRLEAPPVLALRRAWLRSADGRSVARLGPTEIRLGAATTSSAPGRSWTSARLHAAATDPGRTTTERRRARRLAAERTAAPLAVLAFAAWGLGALGWGRRSAPYLVTALGLAAFFVVDRAAARAAPADLAPLFGPALLAVFAALAARRGRRAP